MKQIFETNPEESILYPGFYHIEDYESIVISPGGEVKNLLDKGKTIVSTGVNLNGYPVVSVPGRSTVAIHRLLGLAFLKCPGDPDELVINHKDGIKTNHDLDNLEWTTYTENINHAYENGLRSDNKVTLVKCLETGDVREFYSLQQAAKFFGLNGAHLSHYLNNRKEKVPFEEKWELIFRGEEWRGLDESHIGVIRSGVSKKIVTVSLDGKKYTVYDSLRHLSEVLDVSQATVSYWVTKKGSSKRRGFRTFYYHELRNKKDLDITYVKCDKPVKKRKIPAARKPIPILVTDISTGESREWPSTEQFANSLGVLKATIQKRVWVTGDRWSHYKIEYLEKTKRNIDRVIEHNGGQPLEKSID